MTTRTLYRGTVFRAEHDSTYDFWGSEQPPRSKLCLVFNADPVSDGDEVQYFLTTSKVTKYRETPSILSDVLILPPASYDFFPDETLLDFRHLCVVPFAKLATHRISIKGKISEEDVRRCAEIISKARLLENRAKKLLRLR